MGTDCSMTGPQPLPAPSAISLRGPGGRGGWTDRPNSLAVVCRIARQYRPWGSSRTGRGENPGSVEKSLSDSLGAAADGPGSQLG
jgi:hypothetical protein